MEYTRDLGYCAARYLIEGGNAAMVSIQAGHFVPVPFDRLRDPETGRARVRMVSIESTRYAIARRYMIRLRRDDFRDPQHLAKLDAADVGAGTGIASRQLAAHGVRVLAVEPNAEMRAAAIRHPGIEWRAGTAEATGLDSGIVGLVLCAQAFHWFRAQHALAEFSRILRPGGRLALMWNSRDRADPLTRA